MVRVQDHQLIVLTQFLTPFRLDPPVLQALHHTEVLQLVQKGGVCPLLWGDMICGCNSQG